MEYYYKYNNTYNNSSYLREHLWATDGEDNRHFGVKYGISHSQIATEMKQFPNDWKLFIFPFSLITLLFLLSSTI